MEGWWKRVYFEFDKGDGKAGRVGCVVWHMRRVERLGHCPMNNQPFYLLGRNNIQQDVPHVCSPPENPWVLEYEMSEIQKYDKPESFLIPSILSEIDIYPFAFSEFGIEKNQALRR